MNHRAWYRERQGNNFCGKLKKLKSITKKPQEQSLSNEIS